MSNQDWTSKLQEQLADYQSLSATTCGQALNNRLLRII